MQMFSTFSDYWVGVYLNKAQPKTQQEMRGLKDNLVNYCFVLLESRLMFRRERKGSSKSGETTAVFK